MPTSISANDFKRIHPTVVSTSFQNARYALLQEKKILNFRENEKWPVGVRTVRDHLLRKRIMDTELEENQSNHESILESLIKDLYCHILSRAVYIIEKIAIVRNNNAVEVLVYNWLLRILQPYEKR